MRRTVITAALTVVAALAICGWLTRQGTGAAPLSNQTPEATVTAESTLTPTAAATTPEPDLTPVPAPQNDLTIPEVTITVRFMEDVDGNHKMDPGEPPVSGCPFWVIGPTGPAFDVPAGVVGPRQLLDPQYADMRVGRGVSDMSGVAALQVPPGRYFVLSDIGFCTDQGPDKIGRGSVVTYTDYSPPQVAADVWPAKTSGGVKGLDLSEGSSITVTFGIHWFSGEYEGAVPPVSGGDGALPASGAPQSGGGLGWAPSAAVGLLGLSAVLMVAWAVSARSGRRSHER